MEPSLLLVIEVPDRLNTWGSLDWVAFRGDWKAHFKAGTALRVDQAEVSARSLGGLERNGETQPRPGRGAQARSPVEAVEDTLAVLACDTGAVVAHLDDGNVVFAAQVDLNSSAVPSTIFDQVDENAAQLFPIALDEDVLLGRVKLRRLAFKRRGLPQRLNQ